jgi:UDP:flavonoid glycosyltransferase YjiC (YdhE family)
VAEAVTLAHAARPAALARTLDPAQYEVHFACDPRFAALLEPLPAPIRSIYSIPVEDFLYALRRGRPLHGLAALRRYVEEDIRLLNEVRPDAVVGDLRHSLNVAARITGVPYLTITNAYWSPFVRQRFPMPDLPLTRVLGFRLANTLFQAVRPLAMAAHCRPMTRLYRRYRRPSTGHDLLRMYTDADRVLYADVPELIPGADGAPGHHYIGPVLWSPAVALPGWWDHLPDGRPIVYVTMGSSGSAEVLTKILHALATEPVSLMVATGRTGAEEVRGNAYSAGFLPGIEAAKRSSLVICNGGSPTSQQALAAGVPVLGIAGNMDQHLNMSHVSKAGAGEWLRAQTVTADQIRAGVRGLLSEPGYRMTAGRLARAFREYDSGKRFRTVLDAAISRAIL